MNSSLYYQHMSDLWRTGMEALELLGIGWLVCDSAGQVRGANRVANRILATRDGLGLNSDGVLSATQGRKELLADAVQQTIRASETKEQNREHSLFIVGRGTGKRSFTLLMRSVAAVSTAQDETEPLALLLILDPSLSVQTTESDLRNLYGFTAREACLATQLMNGKSLDDTCCRLGMGYSTARTHLKRMFKKTHARRQSEMISVLLRTIGLIRLRDNETNPETQSGSDLLEQSMTRVGQPKINRHPTLQVH
jgi:DNA-binding CsgD family transcriptional regulator